MFSVSGLAVGLFRREEAARHSCVARESVHGDWSKRWTTAFWGRRNTPLGGIPYRGIGTLARGHHALLVHIFIPCGRNLHLSGLPPESVFSHLVRRTLSQV